MTKNIQNFILSTDMEHGLKLKCMCRLCGVKIPINSKSHPKENFKSAITSLYNIDIDCDSENIHPSKICTACRLRLTRHSQAEDDIEINLPVLFEFLPHSINCNICFVKPGRPKKILKRKLSVPSQSTKNIFIQQEHSYHSGNKDSQDSSRPSTETRDITSPESPSSFTSFSSIVVPSASTSCSFCPPVDSPPLPPVDKLSVIESCSSEPAPEMFKNVVIRSIPTERFCNAEVSQSFMCTICRGVPCDPYISKCSHIFCKECIFGWFSLSSACPVCRSLLDESEVSPLHGHLLQIYDTLLVHCIHANCTQSQLNKNIDEHESICSMKGTKILYNVTTKPTVFKLPAVHSVSAKHTRHRRLKPIISQVNECCHAQRKISMMFCFFMLKGHLKEINDPRCKQVESLWSGNNSTLSQEQCLAIRVDLLQSKGQYRSHYDFISQNNVYVFQAPSKMESCENLSMPFSSIFQIIGNYGNVLLQNLNNPCTVPLTLNVHECFLPGFVELATPNCMGVRFSYFGANSRHSLLPCKN